MSTFRLRKVYKTKNPNDMVRKVYFRITNSEYAVLKQKAALYTEGNLSQWIRAALQRYKPRKSDIEFL